MFTVINFLMYSCCAAGRLLSMPSKSNAIRMASYSCVCARVCVCACVRVYVRV